MKNYDIASAPLSMNEKDLLVDFLKHSNRGKEARQFLNTLSPELKKEILKLKGVAKDLDEKKFRQKLNKVCRTYTETYAIPSKGVGQLLYGSQFASHYLTYLLTLFAYRSKGLPLTYFEERLEEIREEKVYEDTNQIPEEKKLALKKYQALCGEENPTVDLMHPGAVAYAMEKVNGNEHLFHRNLQTYVVDDIGFYPEELNADAAVFSYTSKTAQGFTGTVRNASEFSNKFNVQKAKGTAGKIAALLWEKCEQGFMAVDLPLGSIDGLVKEFIKQSKGNVKALSDPGGYFRGISNEAVARSILQQDEIKRFQGVVFYNKAQEQMILERESGDSIPFKSSKIPMDKRVTFYDQSHCTGSHVDQSGNAVLFMEVGEDNNMRDLGQTLYRMRGIESGQGAHIVISTDLEKLIRLEQGLKRKEPVTLLHLIVHMLIEEGVAQGKGNIKAQKMGMKAQISEGLLNVILDTTLEAEKLKDLAQSLRSFYIKSNDKTAVELFAASSEKVKADEHMSAELEHMKETLGTLVQNSSILQGKIDIDAVSQAMEDVLDYEVLPEYTEIQAEGMSSADAVTMTMHQSTTEQEEIGEEENLLSVKPGSMRSALSSYSVRSWKKGMKWVSTEKYREAWENTDTRDMMAYMDLRTIIENQSGFGLSAYREIFDEKLKVSGNFYGNKYFTEFYQDSPFDLQRNLSPWTLIRKGESGSYELIALDEYDAKFWKKQLNSEDKDSDNSVLYLQGQGSVAYSTNTKATDIVNREDVQTLLLQHKFFQGEVTYTDQEIKLLAKWGEKVGIDALRVLFEKWILPTRSDLIENYERSVLYLFFAGV